MNAIQPTSSSSNRKHSAFIDMTPMVDLGFLLITFFIFTSAMGEKKALKLTMPDNRDSTDIKNSHAETIVLDKDHRVYYYEGALQQAIETNSIINTHFGNQGVREFVMKKKNKIGQDIIVLVRPSEDCTYSDIVDAMDEMMITNVDKWVLMDADKAEYELIRNR
jgi:biopolymer transport protein ExbD